MPRKLRQEVDGGIHHVYARGNDRQLVFLDDHDRRIYVALLTRTIKRHGWACLSFCLMPNHVHLLIETPNANLGAGMQQLHSAYAQTFNARHDRVGHVFQGRYGAKLITDDAQMWTAIGYIAANPVRSHLCERPEDWPWSSHRAILGVNPPGPVDAARLKWFCGGDGDPLSSYEMLVRAACDRGSDPLSRPHSRGLTPIG